MRVRLTGMSGGKIMPASWLPRWEKRLVRITPGSSFLGWWSLLFSQEWWDHIWYGILGSPAICQWRELVRIEIFWVVTGGPQYSGYKTLIVAPEPSVELVGRVVHSTVGRMGTHMSLRVPPWDSMVRPWG
jgi:hypothetical protein